MNQDQRKGQADGGRRDGEKFRVGNDVLLKTHVLSDKQKRFTGKFAPRRDGLFRTYSVTNKSSIVRTESLEGNTVGKYREEDLRPYLPREDAEVFTPVLSKRKRVRPKKQHAGSASRARTAKSEVEPVTRI